MAHNASSMPTSCQTVMTSHTLHTQQPCPAEKHPKGACVACGAYSTLGIYKVPDNVTSAWGGHRNLLLGSNLANSKQCTSLPRSTCIVLPYTQVPLPMLWEETLKTLLGHVGLNAMRED
jgi:hypothetical protein